MSLTDSLWRVILRQIVGVNYKRQNNDSRPYREIVINVIKDLPEVAQQFLNVIAESEELFFEGASLEEIIAKIKKIPKMVNFYSVINYILAHQSRFPNLNDDEDSMWNTSKYGIAHFAAALNDSETIRLLHLHGKNLDVSTDENTTPLHSAVEFNSFEAAVTLKELGASLTMSGFSEGLPMDFAALSLRYNYLDLLYVDQRGEKHFPCMSETFSYYLIDNLASGDMYVKLEKPVDFKKIYSLKYKLLKEQPDCFDEAISTKLTKQEYAIMKTVDFFIDKGWDAPEWFDEILRDAKKENYCKFARFS